MSSASSDSWLALLDEKIQRFHERASKVISSVRNENAFRTAFEDIGKILKEKYTPRLLVRLSPSFENIITFAEAVAEPIPNLPTDALTSMVWGVSFAAIKEGSRSRAKLEYLVKLLVILNKAVPPFEPDNGPYAEDSKLQKPLQDFFAAYIESYIHLLAELARDGSSSASHPVSEASLQTYTKEATKKFEEAIVEYTTVIEEEKKRRIASETAARTLVLGANRYKGSLPSYDIQAQFTFQRPLGRGSFSRVDEVQEVSTEQLYACKRIHLDESSPTVSRELESVAKEEVTIMRKLRHHHIASVLFAMKESDCYNIFMLPVADYNLRQYLEHCVELKYPIAELNPIFQWFGCILDALNHAHKQRIKHRDIKLSNILIKDKVPYLADFGLAKDFSEQDTSFSEESFVEGTPQYFAPEYQPGAKYGRSADIFAMGCVFSEMMTVCNHKSLTEYKSFRRVTQSTYGSYAFRENLPKVREWVRGVEKGLLNDLLVFQILRMLHQDPTQRPTAQQGVDTLARQRALFCIE